MLGMCWAVCVPKVMLVQLLLLFSRDKAIAVVERHRKHRFGSDTVKPYERVVLCVCAQGRSGHT